MLATIQFRIICLPISSLKTYRLNIQNYKLPVFYGCGTWVFYSMGRTFRGCLWKGGWKENLYLKETKWQEDREICTLTSFIILVFAKYYYGNLEGGWDG